MNKTEIAIVLFWTPILWLLMGPVSLVVVIVICLGLLVSGKTDGQT